MKKLHIDFAPASLERTVLLTPLCSWVLLSVAITLWTGVAIKASVLVHEREVVASALKQVSQKTRAQLQEREEKIRTAGKFTIPESQANAVNDAIAELNLPWRDLFDTLEAATPDTIALLSVEPNAKKQALRGLAEAKTSDDMIAYVEQLKKQALFSTVLLTRHEINEQDPNKPLRFQFEAQWIKP
jgi:Tfp pilus assembly protein PilN